MNRLQSQSRKDLRRFLGVRQFLSVVWPWGSGDASWKGRNTDWWYGRTTITWSTSTPPTSSLPDRLGRLCFLALPLLPRKEETILSPSCCVGAVKSKLERIIRAAKATQPDPHKSPTHCLFVLHSVPSQALQWAHSSLLTCHPGPSRPWHSCDSIFCGPTWPRMPRTTCARSKTSHKDLVGCLHPLPVPGRPWSHFRVDFVTGRPPSEGKAMILTIVDRFSKAIHFIRLPKLPSAAETGELLVQHVIRLYRIPADIVSDRGAQFMSQVWRAFCQALGTTHQAEHANQDLGVGLRCVTARKPLSLLL